MTRSGKIPHLRIGTRIVYIEGVLEQWEKDASFAQLVMPASPVAAGAPRRRRRIVQPVGESSAPAKRSGPVRPVGGDAA
jgi:hypothetical protein